MRRFSPLVLLACAALGACSGEADAVGSAGMTMSRDEKLSEAGYQLGRYYQWLKLLRKGPTSKSLMSESLRSAEQCEAEVEHWRGQGLSDGDGMYSVEFNDHPKAKNNTVPLSELKAICKEYRPLYASYKVARTLYLAESSLRRVRDSSPEESYITQNTIEERERESDQATIAEALATAKKLDPAMKVGYDGISLADYHVKVATPLAEAAPRWIAAAKAALRARNMQAAAPYIAAGISGQKLDLIVEYSGVYWRLRGGARTDDPQKLAKADLMFQWLQREDPDDTRYYLNTIRRYQFDGNDLEGVTEKQYRRPKEASLDDTFK